MATLPSTTFFRSLLKQGEHLACYREWSVVVKLVNERLFIFQKFFNKGCSILMGAICNWHFVLWGTNSCVNALHINLNIKANEKIYVGHPLTSKASREVANLMEKNHTPVYGVREIICLSVSLLVTNKYAKKNLRQKIDFDQRLAWGTCN